MIVIIGAGLSGITAARLLKKPFVVLEKETVPGGLAAEYTAGGHRFGYGGHYFHFQNKGKIRKYLEEVRPFTKYRRDSRVLLDGRFIPFPIQFHLASLPASVRKAILCEILSRKPGDTDDLEGFLLNQFGGRLYKLFFEPFLSKFYGRDLTEIMADMDKGSIPVPDVSQVREGARGKKFLSAGYNPVFYYPTESMKDFIAAYAGPVAGKIRFGENVIGIDAEKKYVFTETDRYSYDRLVTTIPLKDLLAAWKVPGCRFPETASADLDHISTVVVNAVLEQKRRRFHWIYLPEKRFPFYRAGYYTSKGPVRCYLEKTVSPPNAFNRETVSEEAAVTLKGIGMIRDRREISFIDFRIIPVSYVVFNRHWQKTVPPTLASLEKLGIDSIGRYGSWNYTSMSDDIQAAMQTAARLNSR